MISPPKIRFTYTEKIFLLSAYLASSRFQIDPSCADLEKYFDSVYFPFSFVYLDLLFFRLHRVRNSFPLLLRTHDLCFFVIRYAKSNGKRETQLAARGGTGLCIFLHSGSNSLFRDPSVLTARKNLIRTMSPLFPGKNRVFVRKNIAVLLFYCVRMCSFSA